jgi:hypothetical protein
MTSGRPTVFAHPRLIPETSMSRRRITLLLAGLTLSLAGCARRSSLSEPQNADRYIITAQELERVHEITLYEAVAKLRPHFLRSRTITAYGKPERVPVHLYVDGDKMDSLDDLRRLTPSAVQEVRFYEPQIANTIFMGGNNAGGVVAVTLKSTGT